MTCPYDPNSDGHDNHLGHMTYKELAASLDEIKYRRSVRGGIYGVLDNRVHGAAKAAYVGRLDLFQYFLDECNVRVNTITAEEIAAINTLAPFEVRDARNSPHGCPIYQAGGNL